MPQSSGDFTIPAYPFSFFNPATGKYSTIELPAYNLKVAKGKTVSSSTSQEEIDIRNKDIRFIIPNAGDTLSKTHTPVIRTFGYWLVIIIPCLILIAVIILLRRQLKLNADIQGTRLAKAGKVARKRLKSAQDALKKGNSELFYDEMLRAIWGYLSDKLLIPASQLSRGNISEELQKHGYSAEMAERTITLIDNCEMAKYAPASSGEQLENTYREACEVIDSIERTKKK